MVQQNESSSFIEIEDFLSTPSNGWEKVEDRSEVFYRKPVSQVTYIVSQVEDTFVLSLVDNEGNVLPISEPTEVGNVGFLQSLPDTLPSEQEEMTVVELDTIYEQTDI